MKIILGSSSKPRKAVMEENNFIFEVMSPDIDEKAIRDNDFYKLPLLIANAKADALIPKISEPSILITADQIVVCDGYLQEKPVDHDEARLFLERYSGGLPAETVSAVVVTNTATGKRADGIDIANTYYHPLPVEVINEYIESGEPLTQAGGFTVPSTLLDPYINKIEGTVDSVRGLPLHLLERLIKEVE